MPVPLIDLKAQYAQIKDEVRAAVDKVLDSGQYILGEEVAAFEAEFATYVGAEYAVAVNSGTSALHLALLAAGIGPGDEVITTPSTFVATVAAIEYAGARAALVDVDPQTLNIDPGLIEAAMTPATKAILPVHLYGHMADMDAIQAIAEKHDLLVIEDAAQAHGAELNGQRAGSLGDFGCFSFYPSKNLGAMGEGGLVTARSEEGARRLRMLRDWGQSRKYHHEVLGFNYRMDGFQGAILRAKLAHLDEWVGARRAVADKYAELIKQTGLLLPSELEGYKHVYYVYVLRSAARDELQAYLNERGIGTGIHYPHPVHLEPAFAGLGYEAGSFPIAEKAAQQLLSIPMYPEMSDEQIQAVADALNGFGG